MRLKPAHKTFLRAGWWLASLAAAGVAAAWMTVGGERGLLLTGPLSDAHHQIGMACESCHAAPVFAAAEDARAALNKACLDCHESELRAADDSHSVREFRNPRMVVYRERLDARLCTSCHVEHSPEITRKGAVTVAADFCVACHSEGEQDVRAARPSHAGLGFDTCADCHNYHDNRALYADFLVKNAHQPWLADDPVHALSARQRTPSAPPVAPRALSDAIAPATALADPAIARRWAGSGHALASVNCATCHMPRNERRGTIVVSHNQNDNLRPNEKMIRTVCLDCHGLGFSLDSLADPDLVARNFTGRPSVHIESIEWALRQAAAKAPDAPR